MRYNPETYALTQSDVDKLCGKFIRWVEKDSSLTIAQFMEEEKISYSFFKEAASRSKQFDDIQQMGRAKLFTRWLARGMTKKAMTSANEKIVMRYLRMYDMDGLDVEAQLRGAANAAQKVTEMEYLKQSYSDKK